MHNMSKCSFAVNLTTAQVLAKIKDEESGDLVHEEIHHFGGTKYYGVLIFEKYFMRVSSKVALIVLVDNLNEETIVTSIAAGSSQSMVFNFDWGAADDFAYSVKEMLDEFVTREIYEE